jgi:hypothetical protein
MKIFGQPENYSDMLERIFIFSLGVGVFCVLELSFYSPSVKNILDSISIETDIGLVKGLKALYVVVPLIVAIISRVIKLHDRISDIFLIRHKFDVKYILFPIVRKVGSNVMLDKIQKNRIDMMYKVFYPYAGFKDPSIDAQLVRSALDNWGWLWVEVESCCLFLLTAVIFLFIGKAVQSLINICIVIFWVVLYFYSYNACIKSATAEVNAIVDDKQRKNKIFEYLSSLK